MKLKFRAFLKSNKLMYDVLTLDIIDSKTLIQNKEKELRGYVRLKDIELMQYTGLKDRNGKEIYEGDIVLWKDKSPMSDGTLSEIVEVFWNNKLLEWGVKTHSQNKKAYIGSLHDYNIAKELKVLGNIYENKEIIENI